MIFGSLGLLVVGGGFLAAGITKSSTGFLAVAFVCTIVAGLLLLLAYAAARNPALGSALGAPAGTPASAAVTGPMAAGPPGTTPVVMYVPVQQVPGAAPAPGNGETADADMFAPAPPITVLSRQRHSRCVVSLSWPSVPVISPSNRSTALPIR